MKKLINLFAILSITVTCVGCGDINTSSNKDNIEKITTTATTTDPMEYLQNAYDNLVDLNYQLSNISDAIQGSWYYGIYKKDKTTFLDWSLSTGLNSSELKNAAEDMGYSQTSLRSSYVDFNTFIFIAEKVMQDNGTYSKAEQTLNDIKKNLKSATNDLNDYDDIKKYYTSALAYYQYLKNPTGNYNQMTDTMNNYENELNEYKNDLSFDFGSDFSDDFDDDTTTINEDDII